MPLTKYSLTKGPTADNTFALTKDPAATKVLVTKTPGSATVTFSKDAATKVAIVKNDT